MQDILRRVPASTARSSMDWTVAPSSSRRRWSRAATRSFVRISAMSAGIAARVAGSLKYWRLPSIKARRSARSFPVALGRPSPGSSPPTMAAATSSGFVGQRRAIVRTWTLHRRVTSWTLRAW